MTLMDIYEVKTDIASMVTVCIVSFEGIGGLRDYCKIVYLQPTNV